MVAVIGGIIFIERGQRKIPVQYAKRVVGRKVFGGQSTHLPLKVNTAGVIPPIFASSIIMFPATIAGFIAVPWVQAICKTVVTRHDYLYDSLCWDDILFQLFLYSGDIQSRRYCREPAKAWRFYPGYQTRTEDNGIHLSCAYSSDFCWSTLSCHCLCYA